MLTNEPSLDYGDSNTDNMIIHGDNLIALKVLQLEFAEKVKCIYIDPPYNIKVPGIYDDNMLHDEWISFMKSRLEILRKLLSKNGTIWIQIGEYQQAYLKVLCDQIFGRNNFVNMISVNMKNISGVSGGGQDKRLKKNCEFILVYAKDYSSLERFNGPYVYTELHKLMELYKINGKKWQYNSVLADAGSKEYRGSTFDASGNEIKIYSRKNPVIHSITTLATADGISIKDVYEKYGDKIFQTTNAQTTIRTKVMDYRYDSEISDELLSIEYIPRTGRNKSKVYEQFYKGDNCRLFVWLRDTCEIIDNVLYKKELQGTYWDMNSFMKNLAKQGGNVFVNGKKPEELISRILDMTTNPGDLVLDCFLGSGTTAAVSHKMGRQYIGIELADHCYTHCLDRLRKVVDGEQGGVSKEYHWNGGGGFKFYETTNDADGGQ